MRIQIKQWVIIIQCLMVITLHAETMYNNTFNIGFRNTYNAPKDNIINIQDFAQIDKNLSEVSLISNNTINFNQNFYTDFQGRLLVTSSLDQYYTYHNEQLLYIDELYANLLLNNIEIVMGRKKNSNQVAFFYPVVDVLSTKKRIDISYNDKNIENSGQDIFEVIYINENSSIMFAYIPYFHNTDVDLLNNHYDKSIQNVFFGKMTYSFSEIALDLGMIYTYKNDANIVATTITKNAGDNTIIYLEGKLSQEATLNNRYKIDIKNYYFDIVIGANYATSSNINIIVEYYHNNNGYNAKEWDNLINDVNSLPSTAYPSFINSFYSADYLRQNYASIRVANMNLNNFLFYAMLSMNLDDYGNKITTGFEKNINDKISSMLEVNFFNGNNNQEYGLIPYKANIFLTMRYFV